jgi:hypothetical protein
LDSLIHFGEQFSLRAESGMEGFRAIRERGAHKFLKPLEVSQSSMVIRAQRDCFLMARAPTAAQDVVNIRLRVKAEDVACDAAKAL